MNVGTARQKIEGLTNSWYGYAAFCAFVSFWKNGIGFFSLLLTLGSFVFSVLLTWFIGRRLLAKSSLTRVIIVVLSGLSTVLGTLGVAKMGWTFLHTWSFDLLVHAAFVTLGVTMNARSFNVLMDKSVKAYFG